MRLLEDREALPIVRDTERIRVTALVRGCNIEHGSTGMGLVGDSGVSRETRDRLSVLVALIGKWNPTIRLVAQPDIAALWTRHIDDSLQLTKLINRQDGQAADIGTGAGFPGLVLAIALDRHFYLVESDRRKAAFLIEATRVTQAKATVLPSRAQATKIRCHVLTARAFASVTQTLDAIYHMLAPDTVCLLPKGRSVQDELRAAARDWRMRVEQFPSVTDPSATILRLSEIARA